MASGLAEIIEKHRILVCAGSGGVGKTTTAAAVALWAAQAGRRVLVMTIDPAKRLADALGIEGLGDEPAEVLVRGGGSLAALMLDQKGAWDRLVERHAPSPEIRDRILRNRFYQTLSQSFAGSQEYMAIEQLRVLHESGRYDLIVVDTPPTRHALDFLEAPQRLADFLDRSIIRWFVKPYFSASWATVRVFNRTVGFLFRRLEEATGVSALAEVSEFFTAMAGLFENFEPRVRQVYELLRAPETGFLLVVSPEEQVLQEAEFFLAQIGRLGVHLRGIVVNRVHREVLIRGRSPSRREVVAVLKKLGASAELAEALASNFDDYQALGRGDLLRVESFQRSVPPGTVLVAVPNLASDIHNLVGLETLHQHLFAAA
ncbi:MAG: AAA family ATPase [Candidatus Binatia bacterium]|nr:AAA family ATPase [Candidatus Binatia bacterium]